MATAKLMIVCVAILVIGAATPGSTQWRRQNGYNYQQYYQQQQQRPYQNQYPKGQAGVSMSEAEWVCKNPKTGDMMVIISEDVPVGSRGTWQPQIPQAQPTVPNYPTYPQQPNYPQPQPSNPQPQPSNPQPPINPSQTYPATQAPNQDGAPNTNGENIIDIRFGNQ